MTCWEAQQITISIYKTLGYAEWTGYGSLRNTEVDGYLQIQCAIHIRVEGDSRSLSAWSSSVRGANHPIFQITWQPDLPITRHTFPQPHHVSEEVKSICIS
jgi:hypothetical protein